MSGWGRTQPSVAEVVEPADRAEVSASIAGAGPRGVLARGLGRSYGDAAQNAGGLVVRLRAAAGEVVLDAERSEATVPAGLSIDELLRVIVPQGFFVPVTAGTRFVTIGGAIASDIHGKNHHADGSFGNHVTSIDLLLADGSVATIGPHDNPSLFWATTGGMGLTGIVLSATIRLIPIETSRMSVDTDRLPDLDSLLAAMTEGDDRYRYSVAWVDLLARGKNLGRSVLTRGDHAALAQLSSRDGAFTYDPRHLVSVPSFAPPSGVLSLPAVAAFNELWYRKTPRHREHELQSIATFFHPLDGVGSWNRLYGARGMVQYQFVVPMDRDDVLRRAVHLLSAGRVACFLAIIKRFGPGNPAPLSFPIPGWTLTLDVSSAASGLPELFSELDSLVLDAGGRHYFAKDAHIGPDAVRRGYPRLAEWRATRDAVDPQGKWQSDLARRVGLLGEGD
ncbi:MAG: FAD-binding oxidoreductase [Actinomycetia bacterium]|nr:FAD-binding oxidoreductase [Actinomycetes bacterium]